MTGISNRKILGLTLSEMLVVILLTIIVVGLAFSILGLVQRQMWGIQDNYEEKTVENLLRQALWIDFGTYSQVECFPQKGFLSLTNELGSATYFFNEEYILKDRDTFYTKFRIDKLYFQGDEVKDGPIDAIELIKVSEGKNKSLFVYKKNDASIFMN